MLDTDYDNLLDESQRGLPNSIMMAARSLDGGVLGCSFRLLPIPTASTRRALGKLFGGFIGRRVASTGR